MKLGVFDRLILINILPKEGNFATLKIVREMREGLSFSEEEHKLYEIGAILKCENCSKEIKVPTSKAIPKCECGGKLVDTGRIGWNIEADKPNEINIGEKATDIIVEVLKKLNDDKKLTDQHFSLYEKFVEG